MNDNDNDRAKRGEYDGIEDNIGYESKFRNTIQFSSKVYLPFPEKANIEMIPCLEKYGVSRNVEERKYKIMDSTYKENSCNDNICQDHINNESRFYASIHFVIRGSLFLEKDIKKELCLYYKDGHISQNVQKQRGKKINELNTSYIVLSNNTNIGSAYFLIFGITVIISS